MFEHINKQYGWNVKLGTKLKHLDRECVVVGVYENCLRITALDGSYANIVVHPSDSIYFEDPTAHEGGEGGGEK